MRQFVVAFGTDEGEETTTFNGTIPQALMMMNGELVNRAASAEKGSFLHTVAANPRLNNAAKINYLFLAALARRPTASEIDDRQQIAGPPATETRSYALQDIWWAVLNSNEFILNH